MDTISMLLTGWIIFVFLAIALIKFLYIRFVKRQKKDESGAQSSAAVTESESDAAKESLVNDSLHSVQNGSARGPTSKIVETLTGPKIIQSNRPQRPLRRRRISKDSSISKDFDSGFDTTSLVTDQFAVGSITSNSLCSGPNTDAVEYVTKCHDYLFGSQAVRSLEDVKELFVDALNRCLRESDKKNELSISVVNVSFLETPNLSNIFAECIKDNTVKVTADCEVQMKGEITVSSKEIGIKRCDFVVDRLSGRLSSLIETKNKIGVVKLDGWPEICMSISASSSPSKTAPKQPLDPKLTENIADRLTATLRNAVLEVELDRLEEFPPAPELYPIPSPICDDNSKKHLLVKIVRGTDLGVSKGCSEPYCVVELDDPPQKFQTSSQDKQNPVWNENFVFNVVPGIGELLIEVHDKIGAKFLGCNIISVQDIGDEKSRILPLKSRRMEACENITGAVEVQFTFLDEKEFKSREITEKVSPNGNLIKTTRTVFTKPPDANSGAFTENVIKEFERNVVPNAEKSTLIIHAVQRGPLPPSKNSTPPLSRPIVKIEKMSDGSYTEVGDDSDDHISSVLKKASATNEGGLPGQYGDDHRGRRKTRKGDIFTSLRRRLSKTRSHSVVTGEGRAEIEDDKETTSEKEDPFKRSVSADRQSLLSEGRFKFGSGLGSARSSVSELSAVSGHSTTTYVHENSTLVIECKENRVRKYYLVPPHLAESGKWKKRGKKLHIYNDHTFVAKHIPSGKICEICTTRLPFALGKQGYQCRDCQLICHKECHVRAPSYCAKTTVYDIELGTTKSLDQNSTISTVFSSLFCGKRESDVNFTNKESMSNTSEQIKANLNNSLNGTGRKKKKSNIFRRVARLGKISEENLNGGDRVTNGDVSTTTHLDCSDVEEENDGHEGVQSSQTKASNNTTTESTVSIPNTNEDEQATVWEEKAIPSSIPIKSKSNESSDNDNEDDKVMEEGEQEENKINVSPSPSPTATATSSAISEKENKNVST